MPKNKKEDTSDSDSGPDDRTPAKKTKTDSTASSTTKDPKDNADKPAEEWQLDRYKKVTVRDFKGKTFVDIREYYEKEGKLLPGKKGISLAVPLWKKLLESADEINEKLKKS